MLRWPKLEPSNEQKAVSARNRLLVVLLEKLKVPARVRCKGAKRLMPLTV